MYKVNVPHTCSCFVKSGLPDTQEFDTEEEAKEEAENILQRMQNSFCNKHEFSMTEQFGDYNVYIKPRS
ncbi:hypothetical protein N9A28_04280 [Sulfurimonas sp.]|nr:hypothetical protein [Sulfurimonas sp.]